MDNGTTSALDLLLEQAERERDLALKLLQQAQQAQRQGLAQADQLAGYRYDSQQRWGARPGQTGTAAMLQCVHGFMQRLNQASVQQRRHCEQQAHQLAQARRQLQAREMRVAAVRKLIQRRQQAEQTRADQRAQKQLDEAAQRMAWATRADADTSPF